MRNDFMFMDGEQMKARCSDCDKVLVLAKGQSYNIQVGDHSDIVGFSCPECAARLERVKSKGKQ